MKTLSRLFVSLVLLAALMAPASAGTIYCGVTAEPTPTPSASVTVEGASSNEPQPSAEVAATDTATGSVMDAALMVLQSVLSIL